MPQERPWLWLLRTSSRPVWVTIRSTSARSFYLLAAIAVFASLVYTPGPGSSVFAADVTSSVQFLGNPLSTQYPSGDFRFARNIWDMQAFNNRVYFGGGNEANFGPAPNAGPADIWYYNPALGNFVKEFTTEDEQIRLLHVLSDANLYLPGADPRGLDNPGEFYRHNGAAWTEVKTIPNATHNHDIIRFNNELFATISGTFNISLLRSTDNGLTWQAATCPGSCTNIRVYTLFGVWRDPLRLVYRRDRPRLQNVPGKQHVERK
jgi:hypothetical protein